MAPAETLGIEVVFCPAGGPADLQAMRVAPGTTLVQALVASGLPQRHGLDLRLLQAGIWGKPKEPGTVLRERDRVEIYRPLKVDPKEARRQRYGRHKQALEARKAQAASRAASAGAATPALADLKAAESLPLTHKGLVSPN
jgi:uncharacterized protein